VTELALSSGWYIGWAVGLLVVLIAAGLLLAVIAFGRRIAAQAADITVALDGTRDNTDALWDVRATNADVDRVTRQLAKAREMLTR